MEEIIIGAVLLVFWGLGSYEAYKAHLDLLSGLGVKKKFTHWSQVAMIIFSWGGLAVINQERKRLFK